MHKHLARSLGVPGAQERPQGVFRRPILEPNRGRDEWSARRHRRGGIILVTMVGAIKLRLNREIPGTLPAFVSLVGELLVGLRQLACFDTPGLLLCTVPFFFFTPPSLPPLPF